MISTKQFWATVKVKTINGEVQLHALVDGKKVIITESTVRRDLQLEDVEGVDCLPNATIFEQLALMGPKTTAWNEFSSIMASAIICLATNQKFNFSKFIFESMIRNLKNVSGKFFMYPRNIERIGKGFSSRVTPLFPIMVVQNQVELGEGSVIPTDPHHTPIIIESSTQPQKTQKPRKPKRKDTQVPRPSGPTDIVVDEVVHKELGDRLVRAATTASSLEAEQDSGNITKTRSKATPNESSSLRTTSGGGPRSQKTMGIQLLKLDEYITLVNVQDDVDNDMFDENALDGEEMFDAGQNENVVKEDKSKGIMIEEPVKPIKRKHQISLDEEIASKLQAEFDEEERLAREKAEKEKKAIIAFIGEWDDIQAKIDVDHQLAKRLQAQEQEELSVEEKATLFQQLLEKRRKHFAAKRAEEQRNKPPTQAQQRKIMYTYLKNIEGKKLKFLKNKSFDSIQKIFDRAFKRVNTFVDFRTDLVEGSSKRAGDELEQESTKKQKVDEDKDTTELQSLMEVILDKEEVAIDVVPLATMEYLETLYKLVKAKYGSTRPVEDLDLILWGDLKIMFEPHVEDKIWRNQQDYKVLDWKLYNTCGVHSLRMQHMQIHMLSNLVLLENFNENYSKYLRLLVKLQLYYCKGVNAAGEEVSTAELVSTAYVICMRYFDMTHLPPHEQRHQYLRYEGLQYTDADIVDFEMRLANIYKRKGQSMFTSRAWRRLFEIKGPLVYELILEFFSTFRFGEAVLDLDTAGALQFQLGRILDKGDLSAYWIRISSAGDFFGTPPSYTLIRDPMLRLCHRLIVSSIAGRSQAPEKGLNVIVQELLVIDMAELVRLQLCMKLDDTWVGVAPGLERQPDVGADSPEAAEDAPIADEGASAVLEPVHTPQPPPPTVRPSRTMAYRLARVEEVVHEIHDESGWVQDLAERKEIDNVGGESTIWKSGSVGVLKPQDGCSTRILA
ncbi:hypothetical protein Tco_0751626 [Tanacetum coccineum]|uniref:Uncharacterized protein n=1 Tax=Tanacetum coccineum TaxID=301880 RepID=A0ABQ4Z5K3_9ASTR